MILIDQTAPGECDPLLAPLLQAPEVEARRLLETLVAEHARPILSGVLRRQLGLRSAESSELEAEILVLLVERLDRLRRGGGAIRDFRGYVAVVAYNTLAEHRRKSAAENRRRVPPVGAASEDPWLELAAATPDPAQSYERRNLLGRLWREIRELPERQAAALLLNLRDDRRGNALALLPLLGIATLRELARAMGMPAEELAALWNDLPLEDAALADRFGIARQQVINLRKSARERLARRLRNDRRSE